MEVPLSSEFQQPPPKETYRSVKPPDQCVISYNFEHANSSNFTHNLLIGIGMDDSLRSHRKQQQSLNAPPNKQKLFSIISQPKKVFRNEAHSVNKAYAGAVLPKRYIPQKPKKTQGKQPNISHHVAAAQQSDWSTSNEKKYGKENNQSFQEKNPIARYLFDDITQSPYGTHQKLKKQKSRLSKNQKVDTFSPNQSNNMFLGENKKQQYKKNSHLQVESFNGDQNYLQTQFNGGNKSMEEFASVDQNKLKILNQIQERALSSQLLHQRDSTNILTHQDEREDQLLSNGAQQESEINPTSNKANSTSIRHNKNNFNPLNKKIYRKEINQKERISKQQGSHIHGGRAKSKKEIQDEQLDQLQARVRKQQSGNFKKGYYKISNNRQRQILPSQAAIEPLFGKFSGNPTKIFGQTDKNVNNNPNVPNRSDKNIANIKPSHNNTRIIMDSTHLKSNFQGKSIDKFKNSTHLTAKTQFPQGKLGQKENMAENGIKKKPSSNLTAIVTSQKVKRANEKPNGRNFINDRNEQDEGGDLTSNNQIKGFKVPQNIIAALPSKAAKTEGNKIPKSSNKQFRKQSQQGFHNKLASLSNSSPKDAPSQENSNRYAKDSIKITSKQAPKFRHSQMSGNGSPSRIGKSSGRNSSNDVGRSMEGKQIKNRSRFNRSVQNKQQVNNSNDSKEPTKSTDRLKPTIPRNANGKDRNFKNWKDSELKSIDKQSRQSKGQSVSKEKPLSKRKDKNRGRISKQVDLDAEDEDKFGLRSKKKKHSFKGSTKKKEKKAKLIKLTGPQDPSAITSSNQDDQSENSQQISSSERDDVMIEDIQKISSIHNSRITEQEEQATENGIQQKLETHQGNLQELLNATLDPHSPIQPLNKLQNDIQEPSQSKQLVQFDQNGNKIEAQTPEQKDKKTKELNGQSQNNGIILSINSQGQIIQSSQKCCANEKLPNSLHPNILSQNLQFPQTSKCRQNSPQQKIFQSSPQNNKRLLSPQGYEKINNSNKQQDFFEYNIKQLSKFNQTINQTFNMTKYQMFQRDFSQYSRAPIISFIYGHCQQTNIEIQSFLPSSSKLDLLTDISIQKPCEEIINSAISILISIDPWIIQRIFQPFLNTKNQIGIWLHCRGFWRIFPVQKCDSFRVAIQLAVKDVLRYLQLELELEVVLRLISGVRIAKLKSTKKKVLNQLDYCLKKKHVLKAVSLKDSKWGERLLEVVKVEVSKQGENVLKIKQNSEFFWVRQGKFKQIFQHFLLICTRPSHYWTNKFMPTKQSHKSVISISSQSVAHGSVTLYYPSKQKSSLYLYKQLESKVLKFMGSLQQKLNENGNIYFQFRLHGTYYLFLQTPVDCEMSIESTGKLQIGEPEYIASQTLKNDKCEYVEIENSRHISSGDSRRGKEVETLSKLREKFINMISKK